jgi:hypothetical protein
VEEVEELKIQTDVTQTLDSSASRLSNRAIREARAQGFA